jgi:hypothetical protein
MIPPSSFDRARAFAASAEPLPGRHPHDVEGPSGSTEGRPAPTLAAPPPSATTGPRHRVMFAVSFRTAMSDADIYRLERVLGMSAHLHPKLHPSPVGLGVSRSDFYSGLFLLRNGAWRVAPGGRRRFRAFTNGICSPPTPRACWTPPCRCRRGSRPRRSQPRLVPALCGDPEDKQRAQELDVRPGVEREGADDDTGP